jgi:hypothetical protein
MDKGTTENALALAVNEDNLLATLLLVLFESLLEGI